jgi:hypothetical protein
MLWIKNVTLGRVSQPSAQQYKQIKSYYDALWSRWSLQNERTLCAAYAERWGNKTREGVTRGGMTTGLWGRSSNSEFVQLLFLQAHRETDRFFAVSGVQSAQSDRDQFHFRRAVFSDQLKSKVGLTLAEAAVLRINLNLDGAPIASKSHTHPSHSQTSRLLDSSLSLGVPVPRPTQCVRGV